LNEKIQHLKATAYKVATDFPEADGTAQWDSTTMVVVELGTEKMTGIGYSYAHDVCCPVIRENLFPLIKGASPYQIPALWNEMNRAVRNFGRAGIAASAIAAVDIALWDLKAKALNQSLVSLLGAVKKNIPVYGSGGFTSYPDKRLGDQFEKWVSEGITMVKMKVGAKPSDDEHRVKTARQAIGRKAKLFVDANGAFAPKQALRYAEIFSQQNVAWFEEPVSSDDLRGLNYVRHRGPASMDIAAGEYNYDLLAAKKMLESESVDVLQADATRCGITGFLQTAFLCEAFQTPLSAHTAPAVHAHLCCATNRAKHVEYFHDHVRIEHLFFDGPTTTHKDGYLEPDPTLPGLGLEFKRANARKFQLNT